jgi:hypothetical protein
MSAGLFMLQRHRLVAAPRFEVKQQREVAREGEGGKHRHFPERGELAGGRGGL